MPEGTSPRGVFAATFRGPPDAEGAGVQVRGSGCTCMCHRCGGVRVGWNWIQTSRFAPRPRNEEPGIARALRRANTPRGLSNLPSEIKTSKAASRAWTEQRGAAWSGAARRLDRRLLEQLQFSPRLRYASANHEDVHMSGGEEGWGAAVSCHDDGAACRVHAACPLAWLARMACMRTAVFRPPRGVPVKVLQYLERASPVAGSHEQE